MSYARIFLSVIVLIALVFFLLDVVIVAAIFGAFALWVLFVVVKEGL